MARRVHHHADCVLWLHVGQPSPARKCPLGGVVELTDPDVEVLSGDRSTRLSGPYRRFPLRLELEVQRRSWICCAAMPNADY
jgi:hypothetical protein